jgi:2-polyprenyl-6-methoxyphenol hydroxylase-like FAD-dependent oxidoreductase
MLLARRGYRVLLVDKAKFPRETISTHYIQPIGVAYLRNWGLLERVKGSNCPAIPSVSLFAGSRSLRSLFMSFTQSGEALCPRRALLDSILIQAAARAGAEIRERCPVEGLLRQGATITGVHGRLRGTNASFRDYARVVIGADGVGSIVAREVSAAMYDTAPLKNCYAYSYWSGVSLDEAEIYFQPRRAATACPTNDGLACITAVWPQADVAAVATDLAPRYESALRLFPRLRRRLHSARREERVYFVTARHRQNFFRRPYGDGWALVGDAAYHKDPITALGISDAFRDATFLSDAIHQALSGKKQWRAALSEYETKRNRVARPLYQFTLAVDSLGTIDTGKSHPKGHLATPTPSSH